MIDLLQSFTFANPWWLLGLLLLIPLFFLRGKLGSPAAITYSSLSILVALGEKPKRYFGALSLANIGFIIALALAFIALARPQIHNEFTDRNSSGIDIILAVDISYSMEISDFVINNRRAKRITAAKLAAQAFIDQRVNDRIGIIAFSGRPYVTSPITLEHEWLIEKLHELTPGMVEEQGTAIGSAIAASATRLNEREAKSKVIILVTDGANNSGKIAPLEAAKHAAKLGMKIYTIAIGTETGRLSSSFQAQPRQEFDTGALEEIAELSGGEFFRVKSTDSLVDTFSSIDQLEKTEVKQQTIIDIKELFHWFTAACLIFALLAIIAQATNPPAAPQ
ncbi:VWA domain-containing protein [Akkermansiaceae bacterium]|nr:VWA domain-containing protein [Akkermansiaceae bacterium]